MTRGTLGLGVLGVCSALFSVAPSSAARLLVNNLDAPGEGFNDPAPFLPQGNNPATTLGEARLRAFQYAATLWGEQLESSVTIQIDARFDPLTCTPTQAILGSAGPLTIHTDFPNTLLPNVWYPQALANARAHLDLDPATADISATFSATLGSGGCLGGVGWYYGLDQVAPARSIDLVTVVLHELGHGLGFQSFMDLTTGARLMGKDDAYGRNLELHGGAPASFSAMTDGQRAQAVQMEPDLHWAGSQTTALGGGLLTQGVSQGHVRIYGPSPVVPGSSVSHFSFALAPNQLMEPSYFGPNHDLALSVAMLRDIGWLAATPAPALPRGTWIPFGALIAALAVRSLKR